MVISSVTPAIALIKKEAGPPTLITTGACSAIPSASFTSLTRRLFCGISVIVALKRKRAPCASAARCRCVRGKGWVGHLSGGRKENAVGDLTTLRRAEIGTLGALRRVVGLHIIDR